MSLEDQKAPAPQSSPSPAPGLFFWPASLQCRGVKCSPPSMKKSDQLRTRSPAKTWGPRRVPPKSAAAIAFESKPLEVGSGWQIVVTYPSGIQEHIPGFRTEAETQEWLSGRGRQTWLRARGYTERNATGGTTRSAEWPNVNRFHSPEPDLCLKPLQQPDNRGRMPHATAGREA
jgi:hypothetical protein